MEPVEVSVVVVHDAAPPLRFTLLHSVVAVVLSKKVTVPVGEGTEGSVCPGVTVTLNTTDCPEVEGFGEEAKVGKVK
jgi:hypothetical protein